MPRGLTLVEMLVTVAILIIAAGFFNAIFINHNRLYDAEKVRVEAGTAHARTLRAVSQKIREAKGVLSAGVYGGTSFTSDNDTLVLEVPAVDTNDVLLVNKFDVFIFSLDASNPVKLFRHVSPAAGSVRRDAKGVLNEYVKSLNITYDTAQASDAKVVTVALTTERSERGKTATFTDSVTVKLRNK